MANAARSLYEIKFGSRRSPEPRENANRRGYDYQWCKISKMKRQKNPVCEICNDAPADDVDHIVPFRVVNDPLRTEWSNLQSVCRACHNAKTAAQGR